MTTRTRLRLATALVVLVATWPLVQHGLARRYELDPWAFFGFAMYAVPNLRVTVRAGRLESPESTAEPDWNAISPASYGALREFAERRGRWGRLLEPDDLAERLFAAQPELPAVVIRVRRWEIDGDSSRLKPRDTDYVYAPPGRPVSRD